MSEANERDKLIRTLDDAFRLYEGCAEKGCSHHEPDEIADLADAILAGFMPQHDKRVVIEYEERRRPDPVHIDNIDGVPAAVWFATQEERVRRQAAAEALEQAANWMQVGIGDPWRPDDPHELLRRHWQARREYLYDRAARIREGKEA